MPLLWARCTVHPEHLYEVNRPLAMYPAMPTCPQCGAETTHDLNVGRMQSQVDPVVLFRGPDGQIRFVGDANGVSAHQYASQGFERIEIRGAAEMRRFEKHMNKHEYARSCRRAEKAQEHREQREKVMRGQLRNLMPTMTRFGRDLARAAMRKNDDKPRERGKEAGFHSDVYSNDRSNREVSRDARGMRRRD